MSDVIRLLPDSVANQIAAGEVIQRPASVIKELVENAVDAGATDIRIIVVDAGRTLIQVIDNGCGMTETDARMAFERHATSKIKQAADLFSLHTMGFRGEALPSICAVAQVELKTHTGREAMGTRLVINASRVESQEPAVCEKGTNIMVKNLFFNLPARRKFLKSDNVELTNIMREFERLALINNNIRMSIERNGKTLDLRPASFKQRISDIWKNNLNMQLLPVDVDTALVKITGFVSRPEHARRRNALQYMFVNGRHMRHPSFHRAVASCFDNLIPSDAQPNYFLKFEVDPDSIDVNIHPTKNEIKFENEQQIWPILSASVKAALGKFAAVPSIDFESDALPMEPLHDGEQPHKPTIDIPGDYNPFQRYTSSPGGSIGKHSGRANRPAHNWESLYDSFMNEARSSVKTESTEPADEPALPIEQEETPAAVCVQFAQKYIVAPSREGLIVIDQHRAHLKILFERYVAMESVNQNVAQQILFPETVSLDSAQQAALLGLDEELKHFGFALEYLEGNKWQITAVPTLVQNTAAAELIIKILDSTNEESSGYGADPPPQLELRRRVALMLARSSAIRRGVRLSQTEMEHIVSELFSLPSPAVTPDGKSVYKLIDERQIERFFA